MVVKLSDFLTTSLVLTALDSAAVINVMRSTTIGIDSNTTGDYVSGITGGTGINATGTGHAAAVTLSVDNTVVTTDSAQTLTNKTFNLTNNTFQATLSQLNAAVSGATLVSLDGSETLTNKTLTTPTINGGAFSSGSIVDVSTFGLRDVTTTAYETRIRSNNASPILTADRILTLDVNNADRTISLTGNLTLGGSFTTSGAHNTTFTTSGATNLTLPTSGTLVSSADFSSRFDTDLATKTTTNLAEGSNLYYTTARADSDFDVRLTTKSTTNVAEGTNLYYTTARADSDFDVRLATKSTTNLSEGSNLYYTTARADSAIDDRVTKAFIDNLGVSATTLGALDSTNFIRSDANDSATGNLTLSGTLQLRGIPTLRRSDPTFEFNNPNAPGITSSHSIRFRHQGVVTQTVQGWNGTLSGRKPSLLLKNDARDVQIMVGNMYTGDSDIFARIGTSNYRMYHEGNFDSTRYLRSDQADTINGVLTVNAGTENYALQVQSTDAWVGIKMIDPSNNDTIWYNGTNGTFTIGGGGANVAGKKLHVDGGMSIGVSADLNSTPSNGLYVQGDIQASGGNTVWHAGNDGSGSTLDADTVDGIQASSFLRSDVDDTTTGNITFSGSKAILDATSSSELYYNSTGSVNLRLWSSSDVSIRAQGADTLYMDVDEVFSPKNITSSGQIKIMEYRAQGGVPAPDTYTVLDSAFVSTVGQFISTVATGTAPLQVSSTTVVTNLNADKLDGQDGSYYRIDVYDASGTLLN